MDAPYLVDAVVLDQNTQLLLVNSNRDIRHRYNSGAVTDGQPLRWVYFVAMCFGGLENTKH